MEMIIEATNQITHVDGTRCRVWKGTTASGIPCTVFIARIAVAADEQQGEFERELKETMPPAEATEVVPLRMVL